MSLNAARVTSAVPSDPFERVFGGSPAACTDDGVAKIDHIEADTMFLANDDIGNSSPDWLDFYVETLLKYVISSSSQPGVISEAQASWLKTRITTAGRINSINNLELLVRVIESADSVAASLPTLAYYEIEQTIITGKGSTRTESGVLLGSIGPREIDLLQRIVNAPAVCAGSRINREAADVLYRIKDATMNGNNPEAWGKLFLEGVGGYLSKFNDRAHSSAEDHAELEGFVTTSAARIGQFLALAMDADGTGFGRGMQAEAGGHNFPDALEKELLEQLYGAKLAPENRLAFDELWERGRRYYHRST